MAHHRYRATRILLAPSFVLFLSITTGLGNSGAVQTPRTFDLAGTWKGQAGPPVVFEVKPSVTPQHISPKRHSGTLRFLYTYPREAQVEAMVDEVGRFVTSYQIVYEGAMVAGILVGTVTESKISGQEHYVEYAYDKTVHTGNRHFELVRAGK